MKAVIKNSQIIEEQRFNHDGTPYNNQEEKIIINDIISDNSDKITVNENDEEITI